MADYLDLPITTDSSSLAEEAFAYLEAQIAGWEPAPGNLDALVIEACARVATESRFVAAQVPAAIFRHFGQNIAGLQAQEAAAASGVTRWTSSDTLGHSIPEGTEIAVRAGDEWLGFATTADATIAVGQDEVADVPVQATATGLRYNGITGPAELATGITGISGVEFTTATAGGTDEESDADYLAALVDLLQLTAARPILARDFAALALRVAGVERATAIDNADPSDPDAVTERAVTVGIADADGEACAQEIIDEVDADLAARREQNFAVHVVSPAYNVADVAVSVTKWADWTDADVQASVTAALEAWLDPATWGQAAAGDFRAREWTNDTSVRLYEAAAAAAGAPGVRHVDSVTINGQSADYALGIPVPANRGAETDLTGWDTTGAFLASGGTLTRDTGQHSQGAASFKLVAGGTQYHGLGAPCADGSGTFRQGVAYAFAADVKCTSGATGLALVLGDNGHSDSHVEAITATGSWVRYSCPWTPSGDRAAADVRAAVRVQTAAASTFYVDNVLVTGPASAGIVTLPRAGTITVSIT